MKIDGRCHCGKISYEAEINPEYVVICHCTDCQTISGAPYRVNVSALTRRFHLNGTPKTYLKRGDSGEVVATMFCADCGTALYSSKGEAPEFIFLRVGAVAQRSLLAPKSQGFCCSAMPWATDISGIPRVPARNPRSDDQTIPT